MALKQFWNIGRCNRVSASLMARAFPGSSHGLAPVSRYSTERSEGTPDAKTLPEKARGFVSSIIHGAPEVVQDHEKSTYSKIISRGKNVHQLESKITLIQTLTKFSPSCQTRSPGGIQRVDVSLYIDLVFSIVIWSFI